jgi:hypothetical protein
MATPTSDEFTIKVMHTGFTPILRILDLCRCYIHPFEFRRFLRTGCFKNLEILRLRKIGRAHSWYRDARADWPDFGNLLEKFLLNLHELDIPV